MAHRKKYHILLVGCLILFLLEGCQKAKELPIPTLMVLATFTPSPSFTPTFTLSPTATLTLTSAPTLTFTPYPAPTLTPSLTATPSPAPTLAATSTPVQVAINSEVGGYARRGPGTNYDILGIAQNNQVFDVQADAITGGDLWFLIEFEPGTPAWISGWVSELKNGAEVSQIATVATIPPSPTITATFTPAPTDTPLPTPVLPPGVDAVITGPDEVNLRSGTGTNYNRLGRLAPGSMLRLAGRNADMSWYQVITLDQRQGWVKADLITVYTNPANLPVSWVEPGAVPAAGSPGSGALSAEVIHRAQAIYQHGQELGNNPHSLMLVGDSVTELGQFLQAFASGNYDLAGYPYLQDTVNFFNQSGTLNATYQTIHSGFTNAMIIDPIWSNPERCVATESPLDCEYRLKKPSIAIIYLGLNDMRFFTPEDYRKNMNRVVQTLIGYGVIPVLTTFTIGDTYEYFGPAPAYLQVMHDTAASFQIPLIDFYEAARPLPNRGTGPDEAHLTFREDRKISFAGDQSQYGETLRELLTLQVLYNLQQVVMGN